MATMTFPLKDVTQSRLSTANQVQVGKPINAVVKKADEPCRKRHDPYNWQWRADVLPAVQTPVMVEAQSVEPSQVSMVHALVQFKCHHGEYSAAFEIRKGQYVVVQGDRGMDVGVVIRINTDDCQQYVERTGPSGSILRHASQREVDYWATDLKADETAALEYCRQRVVKHRLQMDVRHAEYQFDKKKLTFYYEAKSRVDFVTLLKELFREFSCRIWMEKIRTHE